MELTTEEVRHIASLARVGMTNDEIEVMRMQISNILGHFQVLQKVDTEGVEPTGHASGVISVMRNDESGSSIPLDDALSNAPRREGDHVRVRAVMEE